MHSPGSNEHYEIMREKLARALHGICPRWLRDRADDIVQAAMIRLMEIETHREGNLEFNSSYIWKAAYSAMIDEIRRVRRLQETPLDGATPEAADKSRGPEGAALSREIGLGIQDCLMKLRDSRRTAVALFIQGHSVPETARLLGWSTKKTENLVYRGLDELRQCLTYKGLNP